MKLLKSPLLVLLTLAMLSVNAQKKNSAAKMDPEKSILKKATAHLMSEEHERTR